MARRFIKKHLDARLNLPIAIRPCVSFPAPGDGIRMERLFRGLFACITTDSILHVWDIRHPDPTRPPAKIMMIVVPNLMDVVIEPDYNLWCYSATKLGMSSKLLQLYISNCFFQG
jgi:hypothetical protein